MWRYTLHILRNLLRALVRRGKPNILRKKTFTNAWPLSCVVIDDSDPTEAQRAEPYTSNHDQSVQTIIAIQLNAPQPR